MKNHFLLSTAVAFLLNSSGLSLAATDAELAQQFSNVTLSTGYKSQSNHNPLMTQRYGADPYVMVYDDEVFVYMTNDIYEYDSNGAITTNGYGKINTINCISSKDLVNWTDHGSMKIAGSAGAAKWASCSWAPTAMHATVDGKEKFFLYFANNGSGVGVVTSDTPYGPWTDPIGKELISRSTPTCSSVTWLFDPAVLMDDDGTAYVYFGGGVPTGMQADPGTARVVKLGKDYISLDGSPVQINPPYLFEDAGANKIGGKYLYSYCSNWNCTGDPMGSAQICYMTSSNPMGPFTYTGMIFKNPGNFFANSYGNNHHAVFEFKGEYYIAYHAMVLQNAIGVTGGYRSTHIDKIPVDVSAGTIGQATGTVTGVSQVKTFDPFERTEAETMAWMGGIETVDGGSGMLVNATKGDWIGLSNVDFSPRADAIVINASSTTGAVIKVCLDKVDGDVAGYIEVPNTGGTLKSITAELSASISGKHDLFFVFSNNCSFDYWQFRTIEVAQGAYEGEMQTIPGRLEVERYDVGGEGFAYHDEDSKYNSEECTFRTDEAVDLDNGETGYVLGWTIKGEWTEYTVDVTETDEYTWTAKVASGLDGSSFRLYLDDEDITGNIEVPNTGAWSSYEDITGQTSSIEKGQHVLKLAIEGSYCNIDYIDFKSSTTTEVADMRQDKSEDYDVYTIAGIYIGKWTKDLPAGCYLLRDEKKGEAKTILVKNHK